MKYSAAKQGRIFIIRLEDGDIVHKEIEQFAVEKKIKSAYLIALGGIDKDSRLISGPEKGRAKKIVPNFVNIDDVHEVLGTGTIFTDDEGLPELHMHLACGRKEEVRAGCIRIGVKTWHILEIVLIELIDCTARRIPDPVIGFKLLEP